MCVVTDKDAAGIILLHASFAQLNYLAGANDYSKTCSRVRGCGLLSSTLSMIERSDSTSRSASASGRPKRAAASRHRAMRCASCGRSRNSGDISVHLRGRHVKRLGGEVERRRVCRPICRPTSVAAHDMTCARHLKSPEQGGVDHEACAIGH